MRWTRLDAKIWLCIYIIKNNIHLNKKSLQISNSLNLPDVITRENDFEITFYEEIKSTEFKSKIDLTLKLNKILEQMIKKNPNQWIWTHNRWK